MFMLFITLSSGSDWNRLGNFGRGHYEEHFRNWDLWFRER